MDGTWDSEAERSRTPMWVWGGGEARKGEQGRDEEKAGGEKGGRPARREEGGGGELRKDK